jgi:two-component system, LytTR family, response regulator
MKWKTLIIDDEELARLRLRRLLKPFEETIEIIGEASNGAEGLELIRQLQPELVFLDVEMPVYNGFEMLSHLDRQPHVIFATAYDQYAVKAFEENSVDYLLKPIEAERLERTIRKLENLKNKPAELPLEAMMQRFLTRRELKTLTVRNGDRILLVKLEDIVYIEAEDKYVFLQCADGRRHITDYTLTALEEKLPDDFLRIHRGTVINTGHIREIRKGFNGALVFVMADQQGSRLTSGRSYGEELRRRFEV